MTDLKSQSVWICWQYETDKDGRPTKIPYNAKTGGKAMSNNRQSWSDYQTAFSACKKYDGMGFMFADGICGIVELSRYVQSKNPLTIDKH